VGTIKKAGSIAVNTMSLIATNARQSSVTGHFGL
jgi:hypothetical protein